MFNNANVIFRTQFVDGVSTVTRTIGAGSMRDVGNTMAGQNERGKVGRNRGGRVRHDDAKENTIMT